ncbi:monocarboxylate transporter 12-like isoform X2 [Daktulosphaira vitifoliae]|nr:monocarboxylate transporter 12-like isoform X2 [Daktulosphaira vitifoliae]
MSHKKKPKEDDHEALAGEEVTTDGQNYVLVPPDGGWGWLVLLGSTLVNMLIPGTLKSFGVLFVEFTEAFKAHETAASWIPAICYFLYCFLGPLSSYLSSIYSYRTVTLIGGTLASLGLMLCCFANSIEYLYFSYGVLFGSGAGLAFPPGIFIVTSYFVKYRGFANGVAISGSCLGSMFLPPFLGYLIEHFGYREAVLILGMLTLNVWVGAIFYHPVEQHMVKQYIEDDNTAATIEVEKVSVFSAEDNSSAIEVMSADGCAGRRGKSEPPMVAQETVSLLAQNLNSCVIVNELNASSVKIPLDDRFLSTTVDKKMPFSSCNLVRTEHSMHDRSRVNASLSSLRYVSTPFHGSTLVGLYEESQPKKAEDGCSGPMAKIMSSWKKRRTSSGPLELLSDPVFIIILVSNATTAIGYTNTAILLPSYAIGIGHDKTSSQYLLSVVAVLDLVGRIGGSTLSDWIRLDKRYYYLSGLVLSGVSLFVLPFANSYAALCWACAAFGLGAGVVVGITAVIMVDMLGEERLSSSYGISLLCNGIMQLIGPPVAGCIYETIGSYGPVFHGMGIILLFGASVWGLVPVFRKNVEKL